MTLDNEPGLEPTDTPVPCLPSPRDLDRVRALAAEIDCVVTEDLCALAGIKASTAEAWAKRGEGPAYVILGNRRLYPREALRKYCADKLKTRGVDVRGLL